MLVAICGEIVAVEPAGAVVVRTVVGVVLLLAAVVVVRPPLLAPNAKPPNAMAPVTCGADVADTG